MLGEARPYPSYPPTPRLARARPIGYSYPDNYGIPGVKNFADILTKALALEPFSRFRDAALNAKIVFPSDTKLSDVTTAYITRLATYIEHACSIRDDLKKAFLSSMCVWRKPL